MNGNVGPRSRSRQEQLQKNVVRSSNVIAHPPNVSTLPRTTRGNLVIVTMPRSATDATRFTSTIPHASTKSPSFTRNSSLPQKKPGPPGETPYEKVKRLRAAADAARDAQVTGWDKVIVRGRVWADRAHRFTALSLIGLTCRSPRTLLLRYSRMYSELG